MYWNRFESEPSIPSDDPDYQSVVRYLDEQYRLGLRNAPKSGQPSGQTAIRDIKKKSLTFYKNVSPNRPNNSHSGLSPNNPAPAPGEQPPVLFEVDLDLSAIDEKSGNKTLTNYEWTRVYVVRVREDKTDDNSKHSTDNYEWYVLDGESGVLHALNAKFGGVNIDTPSDASEYLDFFCSFLSAEEGVFALIGKNADVDGLEDEGGGLVDRDLFERRHYAVRTEYKKYEPVPWERIKKKILPKLDVIESANRDAQPEITSNEESTQRFLKMSAVTLYGRHIFESEFKITEAGMVEMAKNMPLHTHLAVRHHSVTTHKRSGLILYAKSGATKEIPGAVFMEYVRDADSIAYCSNIVIGGKVEFDPIKALVGLECSNVKFLHDVVFDQCKVLSVFRFKNCTFLGGVSAAGARFCSQVAMEGCQIFALQEARGSKGGKPGEMASKTSRVRSGAQRGRYAIALNLEHARVEGSLSLEWLTVHGSVSGRHLTAQSDANFSGLQVIPLVDDPQSKQYEAAPGNGPVLLDLQRSSFAGSLNLGISVEKDVGLKGGKVLRRTRVTVCGDCWFDTMSVGKSLILEGLAVVKPDSKKVDLTKFPYAHWPNTLSMSNTTIKGNIQSWEYDSWDPSGRTIPPPLVVDGIIDLRWSKIDGYVDLRGSHVAGDLACGGMRAAWLTLEHSRLSDVRSNDEARTEIVKIPWAQDKILGSAYQPSPVGKAPIEWMKFFTWRMSAIGGDLQLGNAIIPGGVTLIGTTVEGTVDVRLGAQLGQIKALPAFGICPEPETGVPVSRMVVKQNAYLGRLSIRDSTIAGPVCLWGAQIGRVAAKGQNDAPKPAIDIATSTLKGGLYLHARSNSEGQATLCDRLDNSCHRHNPQTEKHNWENHLGEKIAEQGLDEMTHNYFWQTVSDVLRTTVKGDVDILATDIEADLDLSNTRVCGRVRLNDSHVKCDVRAVTCLQELDAKDKAPSGSERERALLTELQTQCFHFEFQSLRCDGDMMLAGLAVAEDVDGRNAVVRGHVEFVCDKRVTAIPKSGSGQPNATGCGFSGFIGGDLDLCGCEIGLLRIDGQSFQATANKINLARVTVSTLEIVEPLPEKIDLQSIQVGTWRVEDPKALLGKADPYDSWAYKSVENWLASTGKDAAADEVHVARNQRELKEEEKNYSRPEKIVGWISASFMVVVAVAVPIWPWSACLLCLLGIILYCYRDQTGAHPLDRPLSWIRLKIWNRLILEKVMGFGTQLGPAFCIWLVLAISLGLVLSDPHNVQPTFAAVNAGLGRADLKINTDVPADWEKLAKARNDLQKRPPKDWGFWNHALWLALDITVPLIPFNLHDEWEPKETTEGTVFPCCSQSEMLIAPKTLANIFTPLSWIIWSLIATGMAGVIRTRN